MNYGGRRAEDVVPEALLGIWDRIARRDGPIAADMVKEPEHTAFLRVAAGILQTDFAALADSATLVVEVVDIDHEPNVVVNDKILLVDGSWADAGAFIESEKRWLAKTFAGSPKHGRAMRFRKKTPVSFKVRPGPARIRICSFKDIGNENFPHIVERRSNVIEETLVGSQTLRVTGRLPKRSGFLWLQSETQLDYVLSKG